MIADMLSNKNLNLIVTELFIRGRKLNISLVFITQSYFKVPRKARLVTTHCFIIKIQNKRELQQFAYNYSSDIDFRNFMNLYKKYLKPHSFLVIDATFLSHNHSGFRDNPLRRSWKLIMTIDDKIRHEKLQYDIKRQAAKISALQSVKTDKYEYLTGEGTLPSDQSKFLE